MRCPRHAGAAWIAATILVSAGMVRAHERQGEHLSDHASHAPVSSEEHALRALLARYRTGDVDGAVAGLIANRPDWSRKVLDACITRIDRHITYHRRSENRLGAARDERLEQLLRADRVLVLLLAAALQLDASRMVGDVESIGSYVVASEHTIDALFTLRRDFEEHGALPWPPGADDPGQAANVEARGRPASMDWPAVRRFAERWYPAAVSRLQQLVEVHLAPALIARGLTRFPDHGELLLARGSFVETQLAVSRVDGSLAALLYPVDIRQRWRDELSTAEADLQRAVTSTGTAGEAAVRLARVRLLTGRIDSSRELLDRVVAATAPAEIRYLALLFRAAAAEESGRADDAARDYEAAAEILPAAQAPLLALGRLADERDRPADARKWIERALASTPGALDPWRRYIQGQGWLLDARLAGLRDQARQ